MIDEASLKEFVEHKCYELLNTKENCERERDRFISLANHVGDGWSDGGMLTKIVLNMQMESLKYHERYFVLYQFISVLGDEYKKIYDGIVGK